MTTKDDGLMDVGVHCFACNRLDFLPFACDYCHQQFCGEHRKVDAHNCPKVDSWAAKPQRGTTTTGSTVKPKALSQGTSPSTLGSKPNQYRRTVDPAPRSVTSTPNGTAASAASAASAKSAKAKENAFAKLKAIFPSVKTSSSPLTSRNTLTASAMLKLKREAKGDDRVPQENRIYFYIHRPASSSRPEATLPVFFNKNLVVGKLLDLVCEKLDVPLKNKFGDDRPKLYIDDQPLVAGQKLFQMSAFKTVSTVASDPVTITVK